MKLPALPRDPRVRKADSAKAVRALALFTKARIPITDALQLLVESNPKIEAPVNRIRTQVEQGVDLSEAMRGEGSAFGSLTAQLIEIGERTGNISDMAEAAAAHEERRNALHQKLRAAMAYPLLVIGIAFVCIIILLTFVVPMFESTYASFGSELPAPTRTLIAASNAVSRFAPGIVFGFILAGLLIMRYRSQSRIRRLAESAQIRLPFFGRIYRSGLTARFCRTVGTMLDSGIPLADSLKYLQSVETSPRLKRDVARMVDSVNLGGDVSSAVQTQTSILPPMCIAFIGVGEESGRLVEVLNYLADHFQREVETSVGLITTILEPALIVFIGLVVGGILIALYLPIFELSSVVT